MKICFISNLYHPYERGGAEAVVRREINGLKRANQISLITAGPWQGWQSLWPRAEVKDGITVYRFYPLNFYYYLNDASKPVWLRFIWHIVDVFNIHSFLAAAFILRRAKPTVTHAHNLMGLGYLIPLAIRRWGGRYVQTLHDVQLVAPSGVIIHGQENHWTHRIFLTRWYTNFNRQLFGSPHVVISPSRYLLSFYVKRGFFPRSEQILLRNPSTALGTGPSPAPPRPDVSPEWGDVGVDKTADGTRRDKSTLDILYLGQLERHKGVIFLLETFTKWSAPNARLHIVGRGTLTDEVKRLAMGDARIIFHGYVFPDRLAEVFAQTDVLVVPTLCYENSPNVIYEAMTYGRPVIVSDIGGAAELVKDGKNGWRFKPGDSEALRKILTRLTVEDITAAGHVAQRTAKSFDLESHLERLISLYQ